MNHFQNFGAPALALISIALVGCHSPHSPDECISTAFAEHGSAPHEELEAAFEKSLLSAKESRHFILLGMGKIYTDYYFIKGFDDTLIKGPVSVREISKFADMAAKDPRFDPKVSVHRLSVSLWSCTKSETSYLPSVSIGSLKILSIGEWTTTTGICGTSEPTKEFIFTVIERPEGHDTDTNTSYFHIRGVFRGDLTEQ